MCSNGAKSRDGNGKWQTCTIKVLLFKCIEKSRKYLCSDFKYRYSRRSTYKEYRC